MQNASELWRQYREAIFACSGLVAVAVGLHAKWMPHVAYDPVAPFRVLKWTIEDTYFPVFALAAWCVGKGRFAPAAVRDFFRSDSGPRTLVIAIAVAVILAGFMEWWGTINLLCLILWLSLALQPSCQDAGSRRRDLIEWLIVGGLFAAASYVFTVIKAGLFHLNAPNDAAIVQFESRLMSADAYAFFAGVGRGLGSAGVGVLESVYFQFFSHMLLVSIYLGAAGDDLERRRYALALIVCYLVGGFSYYALPALGPVFFDPGQFEFLKTSAPTASYIQEVLARNTGAARAEFAGLARLDVYGFIACMPSLHLAHESIMLYYCRRSAIAFAASAVFFVATCISVVVLGWHYLTDIPIGMLLALVVIRVVGWVTRSRVCKQAAVRS